MSYPKEFGIKVICISSYENLTATIGTLLLCVIAYGCNSEKATGVTASGNVTANGQPLSGAYITLEPMRETSGPSASESIFDGRFAFKPDANLHGGLYRVRFAMIPASIRNKIPADQSANMPPDNAVIDPHFDADSQIAWELHTMQDNVLDFKVKFLK